MAIDIEWVEEDMAFVEEALFDDKLPLRSSVALIAALLVDLELLYLNGKQLDKRGPLLAKVRAIVDIVRKEDGRNHDIDWGISLSASGAPEFETWYPRRGA